MRAFASEESCKMKKFLKKNLTSLIFEAIHKTITYIVKNILKILKNLNPFRMSYTRKLYKKIKNNYSSFESIHGYSMDDVLLIATDVN